MKITATDDGTLEIRLERSDDYYISGSTILTEIEIDEFALALDEEARAMIIKRLDEEPTNE